MLYESEAGTSAVADTVLPAAFVTSDMDVASTELPAFTILHDAGMESPPEEANGHSIESAVGTGIDTVSIRRLSSDVIRPPSIPSNVIIREDWTLLWSRFRFPVLTLKSFWYTVCPLTAIVSSEYDVVWVACESASGGELWMDPVLDVQLSEALLVTVPTQSIDVDVVIPWISGVWFTPAETPMHMNASRNVTDSPEMV
jgi:hypothetical protein